MEENLKSLAEAMVQLNAMQNADNDQRAVELYRAMFRNDFDINKLDFNYADAILGYVEFGVEKAEVDDGFNRLPEEFTTDDVMRCFSLNNNGAAKSRVKRLIKDHLVEKKGDYVDNGTTKAIYKKTGTML